jgi:hypothetical protein
MIKNLTPTRAALVKSRSGLMGSKLVSAMRGGTDK